MATPDTRHSIVIVKEMPYRGASKFWSNRYHFEGSLPVDASSWQAFADLIVADEKVIFPSFVTITQALGYDSGTATSTNPHGDAVFSAVYSAAGTFTAAGTDEECPGDCAAFLRYATPARSTKNHPVYLSNWYHGVYNSTSGRDVLSPTQKAAIEEYGDDWIAGFVCDGSPRERCGPRGAVATSRLVDGYVRHRDFPN